MTIIKTIAASAVPLIVFFALLPAVYPQEKGTNTTASPADLWDKVFSYTSPIKKPPEKKKWFFNLAGLYMRKVGNTDNLNANMQTDINYDDNISELEISYRTFYSETKKKVYENKGTGLLKFDHYIFPRTEFFVFTQSEYSKAAKLSHRSNSGAGAKFNFFKNDYWKMDISAAPIYQYENYNDRDENTNFRWSFRYRIKITPIKDITASFISFYIPEIDDFGIYRFTIDTYISIKLTEYIALKTGYIHDFNKDALPGTKRYDDTTYAQISLNI